MSKQHAHSSSFTVFFVVILCLVAALVLAVLATSLRASEERARALDRAKQILQSARIYNHAGYFEMKDKEGKYVPARYDEAKDALVPGDVADKAEPSSIYAVFQKRLKPMLTDAKGEVKTFEDAGIDLEDYIADNAKGGFSHLPEKLFYIIMPNEGDTPEGYILPVNGFGLWGPVYGYIALEKNADTVIGTTWEGPAETPGLGAIIQEPSWQAEFDGKELFLPGADGKTDLSTAPLGIIVVKGKVDDVYGDTPRAKTAVDGITGATLTGNGVTAAMKTSLAPYRPLLIKLNKEADGSADAKL